LCLSASVTRPETCSPCMRDKNCLYTILTSTYNTDHSHDMAVMKLLMVVVMMMMMKMKAVSSQPTSDDCDSCDSRLDCSSVVKTLSHLARHQLAVARDVRDIKAQLPHRRLPTPPTCTYVRPYIMLSAIDRTDLRYLSNALLRCSATTRSRHQ